MNKKYEVRFGGSGGQGLILAGIILAEAAMMDGNNCVQTQSYGPEARGGASKSEVIISNNPIKYPKVINPVILLVLSDKAYKKYSKDLKKDGIIIMDSSINPYDDEKHKLYSLPIIKTAREKIGKEFVANIISLGAVTKITQIVTEASLEKAVLNRVPPGTEELNKNALLEGYKLIK